MSLSCRNVAWAAGLLVVATWLQGCFMDAKDCDPVFFSGGQIAVASNTGAAVLSCDDTASTPQLAGQAGAVSLTCNWVDRQCRSRRRMICKNIYKFGLPGTGLTEWQSHWKSKKGGYDVDLDSKGGIHHSEAHLSKADKDHDAATVPELPAFLDNNTLSCVAGSAPAAAAPSAAPANATAAASLADASFQKLPLETNNAFHLDEFKMVGIAGGAVVLGTALVVVRSVNRWFRSRATTHDERTAAIMASDDDEASAVLE